MLQTLMNNSILIVFLLTVFVVGRNEYRRYLQRKGISGLEFRLSLQRQIDKAGAPLLAKLATALIVASLISIVSFREFFLTDVFHTVFLTMLLVRPVHRLVKNLIK